MNAERVHLAGRVSAIWRCMIWRCTIWRCLSTLYVFIWSISLSELIIKPSISSLPDFSACIFSCSWLLLWHPLSPIEYGLLSNRDLFYLLFSSINKSHEISSSFTSLIAKKSSNDSGSYSIMYCHELYIFQSRTYRDTPSGSVKFD